MARKRGSGGFFGTIIWGIFILSCIFAWSKTPVPAGTEGLSSFAQAKSASVEAWVHDITSNGTVDLAKVFKGSGGLAVEINGEIKNLGSEGSTGTSMFSPEDGEKSSKQLDSIKTGGETVAYNRDEWNHWVKAGSNSCWNVREEVLADEAVIGSIVYLDKDKKETKIKSQACSVKSGKWNDPYTGTVYTDPIKLDIDHMIPLSYAAKHGGQAWDKDKKEDYANSMSNKQHLVAVDAGANRSKGDKGPSQWKPANKEHHCDYAVSWTGIATQWKLTLDAADVKALREMLKTC